LTTLHALRVIVATLARLLDLFVVAQNGTIFTAGTTNERETNAEEEKRENGNLLHGFDAGELKKLRVEHRVGPDPGGPRPTKVSMPNPLQDVGNVALRSPRVPVVRVDRRVGE